ncbi:MAG: peptide chain release factor N(5)-glutamine methyltransferase [Balneolaceae bacterium]|nr:peptide chain release factor N(5)-glutamine methyltransferase [Balneolaceae bacterium]
MNKAPQDWTVLSMLEWATDYFKEKNIPDPRLSIEWLLADTLDIKRLDLYLKFDRPLSERELDRLRPLVKRRADHEPLQYILGFTEFMNARIRVGPEVLIPRIETEQLVELILEHYPDQDASRNVLDIGTGSGCIPVALKMERTQWEITGIDISEPALELARENAEANGVDVSFLKGDILNWESLALEGAYDIVVSNPPYVHPAEKEVLEKQVTEFEPSVALFTDDLEKIYKCIIQCSDEWLRDGGRLYLELHEHHAQEIADLFEPSGWDVTIRQDYEKKSRFIFAEKHFHRKK